VLETLKLAAMIFIGLVLGITILFALATFLVWVAKFGFVYVALTCLALFSLFVAALIPADEY
jgi:hypothetical protein